MVIFIKIVITREAAAKYLQCSRKKTKQKKTPTIADFS